MSEYISIEAARKAVCSLCQWAGTSNCDECEHPVDDISAVDYITVIRCEDCKYCKLVHDSANWQYVICLRGRAVAQCGDWYCADGEEKEPNDE